MRGDDPAALGAFAALKHTIPRIALGKVRLHKRELAHLRCPTLGAFELFYVYVHTFKLNQVHCVALTFRHLDLEHELQHQAFRRKRRALTSCSYSGK